jgi:decaprenyl-phosphate phosphoribosyltransferase
MCVASGFVLRAAAGALASDIGISGFFLIVIGASALFVVTGKRYSELRNSLPGTITRPSLQIYSLEYLRFIWVVCVAISLTFYALWAMDISGNGTSFSTAFSFIPFTIAIFRYARNVDSGIAEAPEDMIRNDRVILWSAIIWLAFFLHHYSVI